MTIKYRDKAVQILSDYLSLNAQTATFTTPAYDITQYSKYAFQVNVTNAATLSVTITIEESLDNVNWVLVPGSSVVVTANGSYLWNNQISAATYSRVVLTYGTGSANYTIYAMAKL